MKTLKIPFFRHSFGCLLVCSVGAPLLDVTSYAFAIDSLPLNAYLVYLSWKFYQEANSSSSRKLFRYTLIHLPLLMILMFISRKRAEIHAEKLWKIRKKRKKRKKWGILLLSHFYCHESQDGQNGPYQTVEFRWKILQELKLCFAAIKVYSWRQRGWILPVYRMVSSLRSYVL